MRALILPRPAGSLAPSDGTVKIGEETMVKRRSVTRKERNSMAAAIKRTENN